MASVLQSDDIEAMQFEDALALQPGDTAAFQTGDALRTVFHSSAEVSTRSAAVANGAIMEAVKHEPHTA